MPLPDEDDEPVESGRRPRGWLAKDVKHLCDMWVTGEIQIGGPLTPFRVSELISELESVNPPSQGAIKNVFERWAEMGFATFQPKPYAFLGYTEEGMEKGLDRMVRELADKRKRIREEQRGNK